MRPDRRCSSSSPKPSSFETQQSPTRRTARLAWAISLPIALLLVAVPFSATPGSAQQAEFTPDPAIRLATPIVPANPSEAERGSLLYWYHCMPCHGDRGQGLTDEWREVWVDDHQNCWARGCHAGRPGDEGFPIPRTVPAVIGSPGALAGFADAASLAVYLHQAHPPQRPGALSEEECWALAIFLLEANGRRPPSSADPGEWALLTLGVVALALGGLYLAARRDAGPVPARDGPGPSPTSGRRHR